MNPETRLFIDGELVDAASGRTYPNVNPATEEVMGEVADAGPEDMERAIAAARRAFDETDWSTNHAFRHHCLQQLKDGLLAVPSPAMLAAKLRKPKPNRSNPRPRGPRRRRLGKYRRAPSRGRSGRFGPGNGRRHPGGTSFGRWAHPPARGRQGEAPRVGRDADSSA